MSDDDESPLIDMDGNIKENSLESYIDVGLANGTLIEDPERKGPEVTQTKWNQKGTIYYTDIYRNEPGAKEKGTPIYTRSRVVYDEELTPDIKFRNMTEDKTQEGVTALQEIAGILKIPGGETGTVAEVDLLNRWWAGTEDNYETLKDDGDLDDIFASQRDVAGKYIYLRADEFEEKYGLNHNDALRLAAATEMTDLVFGWNRKAEIVNLSATAISPNDHPATAMLIANNLLDVSQGGRYEGLEASALGAAVIDSFNEIADQYKNDPDRGQALADIILQNETLSQIRIPTNSFEDSSIPERIEATGRNPVDGSFSIAEIFSYAGGKPVIEEVPTPPEDVSSSDVVEEPRSYEEIFEGLIQNQNLTDTQKAALGQLGLRTLGNINPNQKLKEYQEGLDLALQQNNTNKINMFNRNLNILRENFSNYLKEEDSPK